MDKKILFDRLSFSKENLIVTSGQNIKTFKLSDYSFEMISHNELYLKQIKFSFKQSLNA